MPRSYKVHNDTEVPTTLKRTAKKQPAKEPTLSKDQKKTTRVSKKIVTSKPQIKKQVVAITTKKPLVPKPSTGVVFAEEPQTSNRTVPLLSLFKDIPQLRLSEKTTTTMSLLSRGAGVLIACFGIWFSLFSADAGLNVLTQTAQLTQSATTTDILLVLDCTLLENYINPQCANLVNKRPSPVVTVGGNTDNILGSIPVTVTVPYAQQVRVQIVRADTGLIVTSFLTMNKTTDTSWEHPLDTSMLDAGGYRVKVLISNYYGGYDYLSPNTITKLTTAPIQTAAGNTVSTTTNTSPALSTQTTTSSTGVPGIKILSVTPDKTQSVDSFIFYVKTENAESVALEAIHTGTDKTYLIGNADQLTMGNWRRIWNTNSLPLGAYRIRVTAKKNSESVSAPLLSVYKISTAIAPATTASTTITTNPTIAPTTEIKELRPPVRIGVLAPSPLKGVVGISIDVAHASSVMLYLQSKNTLQFSPLGRAISSGLTTWIFTMDSSIYPDGEYSLKAVVRNSFGEYDFIRTGLLFKNIPTIVPTVSETAQIETLKSIDVLPKSVTVTAPPTSTASAPSAAPASTTRPAVVPVPVVSVLPPSPVALTDSVERQLQSELDKLSVSVRMEDTAAIEKITQTIVALKNSVSGTSAEGDTEVAIYLEKMIARTKENVERTNKLITERTKQKASADFDKDLISDYDEVRLYRTNPFVADSDNDGFLDGVEIQSGYDPLDAIPEVLVAYESPKETGIVREDILKVKSIATAAQIESEATTSKPVAAALLSGYALPNSFITLFIYSTPIIVTIKTESDGSWNYRLDKELEDGEHEVYIGVTDNAGKIVAKSERFAFVKRAEAFDGVVVDTPAAITQANEASFFSGSAINLVLGISCIAIGLIFMLFGVNFQSRKKITVLDPHL